MERDYIMRHVEQLGKVMARIVESVLRLKSNTQVFQGIEVANQQLKDELDIDVDYLLTLDRASLKAYLLERNVTSTNFETLSDYLKAVGEHKLSANQPEAATYLTQAITLLELAEEVSATFSFERMDKKVAIEKLLRQ
ncbi:hypothetical protein [Tunicatimonas pelagia]|uniref:hypothetical protein n=1 Tax=Tunicatimonas pelagia TaxID=931531 RepID=UPI0026671D23|nr:hypothetical protein [Tunicatimonas pelagia]WKN45827.1 hypothetical protein P0M28_12745 [Tunicatimonas pelagia]